MDINLRSQNLDDHKKKIIGFIETRGPCLPIHISGYLKLDTLLAGAFLSDLLSDNQLRISNLRVGNSPVYFIKGQEIQLEKFAQHLNGKEKEAYNLLKEYGVLNDRLLLPAIRVALRSIKDFSFSLEHNGNLYWRYLGVDEKDAFELIEKGEVTLNQLPQGYQRVSSFNSNNVNTINENNSNEIKKEIVNTINTIQQNNLVDKPAEIKNEVKEKIEEKAIEPIFNLKHEDNISLKSDIPEIIEDKPRKIKPKEKSSFVLKVEEFLEKNNLKVSNEIDVKKKDYVALISVPNANAEGKGTDYLCIAKEKKAVSDKDLMKYLQIGQKERLPVLFLSNGDASKKAVEWLDYLGNVIVYKKLE